MQSDAVKDDAKTCIDGLKASGVDRIVMLTGDRERVAADIAGRLEIGKEYSIMTITIKDNGCGSGNVKYGFGLTHMQERLEMLHGELKIESEVGFTVIATIPIRWGEDND